MRDVGRNPQHPLQIIQYRVSVVEVRTVRFFSEEEEEFIAQLSRAGLTTNCAKVLVHLTRVKEASSREIGHGADMGQAEISIALQKLTERGWTANTEKKKPGPGRKIRLYRLALPLKKIIAEIEREHQEKMQQSLDRVKRLREFVSGD